jgi:cytochrome c oxidase assembly protein subunit 20
MAEDTLESTAPNSEQHNNPQEQKKPKHEFPKSQVGKLWDAFGNPEESANVLATGPGSSGRDSSDVTVTDAMKSMSLKDATTFYKKPCARDSLLLGIGAGFGIGGVRGVLGGN